MLYVKMNKDDYNKIHELLPNVYPQIYFSLKEEDDNLVALGLCNSAPCIIEFNITGNEFNEMLEELNDIEIEAFNTPNSTSPNESNPAYQKYLKYDCLYDILFNAEII